MKKLYLFLVGFGVILMTHSALATTGGPTYISELAFSSKDNAVYYKVHDGGGRGCPPIVYKVDLAILKDTEVKSCTQVENEYKYNEMEKYNQFVVGIYKDLQYLGSVSLKNNNIGVAVKFISENKMEGFDEAVSRNFLATITQDGKELAEINFKGCIADQPHVFEGYIVPNSDKMGILISNKGDCFEGGYVRESLQIIKGIKYYDTNLIRSFKTASATEPNAGNMVVYVTASEPSQTETNLPTETDNNDKNKWNKNTIYAILAITLGLGLGYFFGRKRKN